MSLPAELQEALDTLVDDKKALGERASEKDTADAEQATATQKAAEAAKAKKDATTKLAESKKVVQSKIDDLFSA